VIFPISVFQVVRIIGVRHWHLAESILIKRKMYWVLVAHICNPSYSGGRDQEDCGSKPGQANNWRDPVSKQSITEKGWWGVA
jgi:hypothetical protein